MARRTFYRPMMYVAGYQADGTTIDTDSVMALGPTRWTSDGITVSATPQTYEDATAAGTFTYDRGTTEGNSFSGTFMFANMKELATLANNGTVGTDETHGQLTFGDPNACATVKDRAVVIIDMCDSQNTYKMVKADHCDITLLTDDLTLGGEDPLQVSMTAYAHPDEETNAPAFTWGTTDATKVFDPTTWTIKAPEE